MIYSIVNSHFFSLSCNGKIIYQEKKAVNEELIPILLKNLENINNIKEVYICTGPGSLVASRSLVAFFLGLNINNNFKIYYIDSLRDIILETKQGIYGCYAITKKKFILANKINNEYKYEFLDYLPLLDFIKNNITIENPILLDVTINNIETYQLEEIFKYPYKIIEWDGNNLVIKNNGNNDINTIVHYSQW